MSSNNNLRILILILITVFVLTMFPVLGNNDLSITETEENTTLEIPLRLTESHLLINRTNDSLTVINISRKEITIGKPVDWEMTLRQFGEKRKITYSTPPINKLSEIKTFPDFWIQKLILWTDYSRDYEQIPIRQSLPSDHDLIFRRDLEYWVEDDVLSFIIPKIDKNYSLIISGFNMNVSDLAADCDISLDDIINENFSIDNYSSMIDCDKQNNVNCTFCRVNRYRHELTEWLFEGKLSISGIKNTSYPASEMIDLTLSEKYRGNLSINSSENKTINLPVNSSPNQTFNLSGKDKIPETNKSYVMMMRRIDRSDGTIISIMMLNRSNISNNTPEYSNLTIKNRHGSVKFIGPLDVPDNQTIINLTRDIKINHNNIILTNLRQKEKPDKKAVLTLENLPYGFAPIILRGGTVCWVPECVIIDYDSGTLTFSAEESGNYTTAEAIPKNLTNSSDGIEEELIQLPASIDEPVRWVKRIKIKVWNITSFDSNDSSNPARYLLPKNSLNLSVELSLVPDADNITILAKHGKTHEKVPSYFINKKKTSEDNIKGRSVLAGVIKGMTNSLTKTNSIIKADELTQYIKEQKIDSLEIIYTTPSPRVIEKTESPYRKLITIASEHHYKDIDSYTDITPCPRQNINLFWIKNGTKERMEITRYEDTDGDGLIDRIHWITPHLSNQTFEVTIDILNLQSYPLVGSTWSVRFTTTGTDTLIIEPTNGTTWDDLSFQSLTCVDEVVTTELIGGRIYIENYNCSEVAVETSKVLTSGKHYLNFTFGNTSIIAKNYATFATYNSTQVYTTTSQRIATPSGTPTPISFEHSTMRDTLYYDDGDSSKIFVNDSGTYKIFYGCVFKQETDNNRTISDSWIMKNNASEIIPSRQSCYSRSLRFSSGDTCSNSAILLADLTKGDFIQLQTKHIKQDAAGTVNITADCWLGIEKKILPSTQIFDKDGGDTFNTSTPINLSFESTSLLDSQYSASGNAIRIKEDGLYKLYYHACFDNDPQTNRNTPLAQIQINGTTTDLGSSYTYLRNNANGDINCLGAMLLQNFSSGDEIKIHLSKYLSESTSDSTVLGNQTWMLLEQLQSSDAMMIYDALGGNPIAAGTTEAVDINKSYITGRSFSLNSNVITINRSGYYELSYGFTWDDEQLDGRHKICTWLQENGSATIVPSKQCGYSRGDLDGNDHGSNKATIIHYFAKDSTVELMAQANGGEILTEANGAWLSIIPFRQQNLDVPQFSSPDANRTLAGLNDEVRFSVTVTDATDNILFANATIGGIDYNLTQGTGNIWYYDWQCTSSNKNVNMTYVWASDDAIPSQTNSTTYSSVSTECDASAPIITSAKINDSSEVALNTTVKINASVTDSEGNLQEVWLVVYPPGSISYEATLSQNGNEFYNDTFLLNKGGDWYFEFHANDTAGNIAIKMNATDQSGNNYISVSSAGDTDSPQFSNESVNTTLSGNKSLIRFAINITDASSGVEFANVTINGSTFNLTKGTGMDWYYDWNCTTSGNITMTYVWANDSAGNTNSTSIMVWSECDVNPPIISSAEINDSSDVDLNTVVKVNASISDPENHLSSVLLQIDPKYGVAAYNITPDTTGSTYSYNVTLNASGKWTFTFFANDSLGQYATSVIARDQLSNDYIRVTDTLNPEVTAIVLSDNPIPVSEALTIYINVSDDIALDSVKINLSCPNGSTITLPTTNSTPDYFKAYFTALYPGDYVATVFANDSSSNVNNSEQVNFLAYDFSEDVAITPINETFYALMWSNTNKILLETRNTWSESGVKRVVVDETAQDYSRVSLVSINNTHFIAAWVDGASEYAVIAMYDKSLDLVKGPTVLESSLGVLATDDKQDIDVTILSDDLISVGWVDDAENDYDEELFNITSWSAAGAEFGVDTTLGPDAVRQNYIAEAGLNASRIAHIYFDDGTGGPDITIQLSSGTSTILGPTDINDSDGYYSKVAIAGLPTMSAGFIYFNDLNNEVLLGMDNYSGDSRSVILASTVVDVNSGVSGGVAATRIEGEYETPYFLGAWHDANDNTIKATTYYINGTKFESPFIMTTAADDAYQLFDVIGESNLMHVKICPNKFIVAYTNSSERLVVEGFDVGGSAWNGVCGDSIAPNVTSLLPSLGTSYNASDVVNITANIIDNRELLIAQAQIVWDGGSENVTMTDPDGDDIYNATVRIYTTGRHNVTIFAWDKHNNLNNSETTWFNVTYTTTSAIYCEESPCIANSSLIRSVDSASTAEPNQPNTIDSCTDGTSGSYQSDESVENISIESLNGSDFRAGDTVRVNITAYCYDDSSDNINFVYANDSSNIQWSVISYVNPCPASGFNTVSTTFKLNNSLNIQAFRGIIQYQGSTTDTCGGGNYDDNDDLEFLVKKAREYVNPSVNISLPDPANTYYYKQNISISVNVSDENDLTDVHVIIVKGVHLWHVNLTDIDLDGTYTGKFTDTLYVGNHSVTVYATDEFGNTNDSETTWFMLNDTGTLSVKPISCTPSPILLNNQVTCTANISDNNTPIDTVIANVTHVNGTVFQPTLSNDSEIYSFNFSLTTMVGTYNVVWWANNTNAVSRSNSDVFRARENTSPNVTLIIPIPPKTINSSDPIILSVNATDDTAIDGVIVNVTLPNGTVRSNTMTNVSLKTYNYTFTETSQLGNYSIVFSANDTSGNINDTVTSWFNTTYVANGAIFCEHSPCIANSTLIRSVDSASTPEPNQPNTIDSCTDGTSGSYQSDESVENISIESLNGSDFRGGDTIRVNITVYCYDSSSDNINFVYTNSSSNINWNVLNSSGPCPSSGVNTFSRNFTLDRNVGIHAFRGIIQYQGSATDTCGTGSYDDNDDLEFYVNKPRESDPPSLNITSPRTKTYLINETILLSADVSDVTDVEYVSANVSWGSTWKVMELTLDSGNNYTSTFTNTSYVGRYNVTYFANDTFNNVNDSEKTYFNVAPQPLMEIIYPLGETMDTNSHVHYIINISTTVNISNVTAITHIPNGTNITTICYDELESDNFSTDTEGITWDSYPDIDGNQTCAVDISTTNAGKSTVELKGYSPTTSYSTCGYSSDDHNLLIGDFNITINFSSLTSTVPFGSGFYFSAAFNESEGSNIDQVAIARVNNSDYGDSVIYYSIINSTLNYTRFPQYTMTEGYLRLVRKGDNFSAYIYDEGSYRLLSVANSEFNLPIGLHAHFGIFANGLNNIDSEVVFDNFTLVDLNETLMSSTFDRTATLGLYNITINLTNVYNVSNTSETNMTIAEINDPPSIPMILDPDGGEIVNGTYLIQWVEVTDEENDTLNFEFQILDSNHNLVDVIESDVPNSPFPKTNYSWDTTSQPDGDYYLKVLVTEVSTPEAYSRYDESNSLITIRNEAPKVFLVTPIGDSFDEGSRMDIVANISDGSGIAEAKAIVTHPNGTIFNIMLDQSDPTDHFDVDTIGLQWGVSSSKDQSQTCSIDMDSTVNNKAYQSFEGTGTSGGIHTCTLTNLKDIFGDFDINVTFGAIGSLPRGTGIALSVAQSNESAFSNRQFMVSRYNSTIFNDDGVIISFNDNGSSSTEFFDVSTTLNGSLRIRRVGNNFTAFVYDQDGTEHEIVASRSNLNLSTNLNVQFGLLRTADTVNNVSATFDDLQGTFSELYGNQFDENTIDGVYNYSIYAESNYARVNDSQNSNFTILFVNDPPSTPLILTPTPGSYEQSMINITWTEVIDEENDSLQYNISLLNQDGTLNHSIISNLDNSPFPLTNYLWNATHQEPGNYRLKVTVFENETADGLFSTDTSENFTIFDITAPVVTLNGPINNSGDSDFEVVFNYTVEDNSTITNCSLYINESLNRSDDSITKGTFNNFTISDLSISSYSWRVVCEDSSGNNASSETRIINVFNASNFTGEMTDLSAVDVRNISNLFIGSSGKGNITFLENINLSGGADINSVVTISNNLIAIDSSSEPRLNRSANLTLANLSYVHDPYIMKNGDMCGVECSIISYDNSSGILRFNVTHFTNYSSTSNSQLRIYDETDPEGGSNTRYQDQTITFFANYSNTSSNLPIKDTGDYCSIRFNESSWTDYVNMTFSKSSNLYEYDYSFSEGNNYTWNVFCSGINYEDINLTDSVNVLSGADLYVGAINYSEADAVESQEINISINVSNNGTANATNVTVQLNISVWNGTWLLDENYTTMINLSANTSKLVNFTWTVKIGTYQMLVLLDHEDSIPETNESNNDRSENYTTSAWQLLYGSLSYNISLASASTDIFQQWVVSDPSGTIYYSDVDSSYHASDLLPLNGTDDLSELDIRLNMTWFDDSISSLYDVDNDNVSDMTGTFLISGSYVSGVPVINSTNSSTFLTGIMYDSADGIGYDGTQDVVFVTSINYSRQGSYGIYDYEIKLPSPLKRLVGAQTSVSRIEEMS